MRIKHRSVLNVRNELVAHMDISKQDPKLDTDFSYTVKGYELTRFEELMPDVEKLVTSVVESLLQALHELKKASDPSIENEHT